MPRPLRLALIALGGLAGLTLVALGTSAALDQPARVVTVTSTLEGSKQDAWRALTAFEAYSDWNPVFTEASGEARADGTVELAATLPGHDPEQLDAKILIFRPERKLRWQDRLRLPGVRDWEYELVLDPIGNGRVRLTQVLHFEGLLAPFADTHAAEEALELQAAALAERLAQR